jgi:hypothetical protein
MAGRTCLGEAARAPRSCRRGGPWLATWLLLAWPSSVLAIEDAATPAVEDAAAPARSPAAAPSWEWSADRVDAELAVSADSLRLRLPRGWVQAESFRLVREGQQLTRGLDFLLDPRRGAVRLLRPLPPGTRLLASYRSFPVPLRPEYRRHVLRATEGAGEAASSTVQPARGAPGGSESVRLDLTGSKTFSIEVGSRRDPTLQQSLDLALDGRIGRDLAIKAILTDRRTPLQPEGGSARLSDLDRILVEAESPNVRLSLGDIRLTAPAGEFLRYDRRLQGVRVEATPSSFSGFAAAATAPGTYVTREFLGQEGKQGPYVLAAASFSVVGAIVAGSERVVLDGRLLTRGETEDYLVDYAGGTLTFTNRHPITAYSEITVEIQVVTESYRRSAYAASAALRTASGPAGVDRTRVTFLAEGDDHSRPMLPLSAAQRAALRAAGDSLTPELSSGIRFVGPGLGDYDLVRNDTLAVSFFLYKGAAHGSYLVRFDDVGDGKGDYADTTAAEGDRFYVYTGRKKGRFLPGGAVPRPERNLLAAFVVEPGIARWLRLRGEGAVSEHDPNTFSSRDDGDNRGTAWKVENRAGPFPVGPLSLALDGSWRVVEARFHPFDRIQPSFRAKEWNVEASRLERGERSRSAGAEVAWGAQRLSFAEEELDNRRDFRGTRDTWTAEGTGGPLQWSGRISRARTRDTGGENAVRGRRMVERGRARWPGGRLILGLDYARERDERGAGAARSGAFFREGSLRAGTGPHFPRIGAELSWTRRLRWTLAGRRALRLDTGDTGLLSLRWTPPGGRRLEAEYARRDLRPHGEGERSSSRLGRLRWTERAANEAFVQDGTWELSTSERAGREKEIRFVGGGFGHYDSLGVFTGTGDYDIFYRELGDSARVNRIDFSLRHELDLSRLESRGAGAAAETSGSGAASGGGWGRALRTLRLTSSWTARTETGREAGWYVPRLLPVLAGARELPLVEVGMRAEASALPAARWLSPRLRWERRRAYRAFLANSVESSRSSLWGARFRSRPAERWTADVDVAWDRTEQRVLVSGRGAGRDGWRSVRAGSEQRVQVGPRLAAGLDVSSRLRRRLGLEESARVFEGTPYVVWSPRSHSRLEVRWTRTSVARDGGAFGIGRLLETPGSEARVVGTVRLREELDLSLWYRERRPDRDAAVRDGRMELRATF